MSRLFALLASLLSLNRRDAPLNLQQTNRQARLKKDPLFDFLLQPKFHSDVSLEVKKNLEFDAAIGSFDP